MYLEIEYLYEVMHAERSGAEIQSSLEPSVCHHEYTYLCSY